MFRGPTIAGGYNQAALCANLVVGCSTPLRVSSNPLEDPANTLSIRIGGKTTSFWREHSTSTGAAPPVLKLNNPDHTHSREQHSRHHPVRLHVTCGIGYGGMGGRVLRGGVGGLQVALGAAVRDSCLSRQVAGGDSLVDRRGLQNRGAMQGRRYRSKIFVVVSEN